MIVRVWCENGAGWSPTPVPVTPHTTSRDVLDCCRDPGDEPCLLLSVHPHHGGNFCFSFTLYPAYSRLGVGT